MEPASSFDFLADKVLCRLVTLDIGGFRSKAATEAAIL